MKENEEILRNEICELKIQVHAITEYLEQQKRAIEEHAAGAGVGAYNQQFWSQQQVSLGCIAQNQSIDVYVEVAPGKHKQVQPIISEIGGQTQLDFDMPYTGYVVIGESSYAQTNLTLPYTPPVMPINEIALLIEPELVELVEPIIRTGIHDTWQR